MHAPKCNAAARPEAPCTCGEEEFLALLNLELSTKPESALAQLSSAFERLSGLAIDAATDRWPRYQDLVVSLMQQEAELREGKA